MTTQLRAGLAALFLLLACTNASAGYNWYSGEPSETRLWFTAQDACTCGEAERLLRDFRAAQPDREFRLGSVQVNFVDPYYEAQCRIVIKERITLSRWLSHARATSVFFYGEDDACGPGLLDPETGLCGSRKGNGTCPGPSGSCGGGSGSNGSNPINTFTGTKVQRETDYLGVGNHPLMFERFYKSRDHANGAIAGPWRHTYSATLGISIVEDTTLPPTSRGSVWAHRPDGRVLKFAVNGTVITQDPDISERLLIIPQAGDAPPRWVLVDLADRQENYNADGRLETIVDRTGQVITLNYSSNGRLLSVRDHFNRTLTFSYDGAGRINGFTDPDNKFTGYGYDSQNRLWTVTRPDTKVRIYLYNEPVHTGGINLPDALTGIIDETGQRYATWTYDATGRATSSRLGTGPTTQRFALTYNANGTTTVTDPVNTARDFVPFVSFGVARLQSVSQPCPSCGGSDTQNHTFDTNGNINSQTDYNGHRTDSNYDLARNLETLRVEGLTSTGASTPNTRTISSQWHPTWRQLQRRAEPLLITTHFYHGDTDGGQPVACGAIGALCRVRMQATTDGNGAQGFGAKPTGAPREWNYTYNAVGQRLSVDGPRTDVDDVTTHAYAPGTGNMTQMATALNQVTQFTSYDGNGRPLTIVDPDGVRTTLTYDYRGLPSTRTVSDETTTFTYTEVGLLRRVTLADGNYTEYSYDAAHRLESIVDNLGFKQVFTRNDAGNITRDETFNPDNSSAWHKTRVFNALSRLESETGGETQFSQYFYDAQGNLTTTVDGLSRPTVQAYDELNRLRRITQPPPAAMQPNPIIQLNVNGRDDLTQVIDPRNLTTQYTVNGLGDVSNQVSPDTGMTIRTFDAAGNVLTSTDARGSITTYSYDALNRVIKADYDEDIPTTYLYDKGVNGTGRLTGMSYFGGFTDYPRRRPLSKARAKRGLPLIPIQPLTASTAWTYDEHGRPLTKTQTVGASTQQVAWSYNSSTGQMQSMTYPSGRVLTFGYGAASKDLESILLDGVPVASAIAYHPFGGVKRVTLGNGRVWSNSRDNDGRVNSYTLGGVTYSVHWDAANRIYAITHASNSFWDRSYGYDNLDRVTSFSSTPRSQSFGYDLTGNLTAKSDVIGGGGTTNFTYSIAPTSNRMTAITSHGVGFSFDEAGNRIDDGRIRFVYDARGRMSGAVISDGVLLDSVEYVHDGLGLRVKKSGPSSRVPDGARTFIYDEQARLLGEYDNLGRARTEHVWLDERPIAVITYTYEGNSPQPSSTTVSYVETDHLGTPRLITNQVRTVRWYWHSAPYGDTLPNENPAGLGTFTYNLRFPGQYFDAETGLHYNVNRDYESTTGRYVQSDPLGLGGGINTYLYVGGNPINYTDSDGLQGAQPAIPPVVRPLPPNAFRNPMRDKQDLADNIRRCLTGNCAPNDLPIIPNLKPWMKCWWECPKNANQCSPGDPDPSFAGAGPGSPPRPDCVWTCSRGPFVGPG